MAECLLRLSRALGDAALRAEARRTLDLAAPFVGKYPTSSPYMLLAARLGGPEDLSAVEPATLKSAARETPLLARSALIDAGEDKAPSAAPGDRVVAGAIVGRANP